MKRNLSHITVAILAAGASKRMGTPKQLLTWGKKTSLLTHAIETASDLKPAEVIVVLGAYFDRIKTEISSYSVTVLKNDQWERGLGTSISCAAEYLRSKKSEKRHLLVMLADQPFISTKFLKEMCMEFSADQHHIIASTYQNRPYGVPALFDASYLQELAQLHDDYGARYLLKKYQDLMTLLKPPRQNPDIDTQDDYENNYKLKFKQ